MAKGKHATALFEVIHASKQFGGKDKSGLLRTPKWWFKGRPAAAPASDGAAAAAARDPNDPTAGATLTSPLAQHRPAASDNPTSTDAAAHASAADPTQLDEFAAPRPPAPPPQTAPQGAPAVDVDVDSGRQRITFRFTYTSALVACFAIAVVVALAYLVGRQMSRGPAQAMGGPSTDEVRQGPARPEVMDVGRGTRASAGAQPQRPNTSEPDDSMISTSSQPQRTTAPPPPTRTETPKLPPADPTKRVTGLNYVIIQSYPDEASAKGAVDALKQYGVTATIEKGLRGYSSGWHSVVGTEPFARISSPEYAAYLQKINQISDKFASRRSFKAFEPRGYKWDRQ